jgi:hypothetical protein
MTTTRTYFFLMIVTFCSIDSAPIQASELYVFAPTLSLQVSPGPDQMTLGTLSYGERVEQTAIDPDDNVLSREWIRVRTDLSPERIEGYAHSEALLPIPAPDLSKSGFSALTDRLTPSGKPATSRTDDTTTAAQTYSHGVTLITRTFHTPYGDFAEQMITISGLSVAQGFLLARAIVNPDGPDADHMSRTARIEFDEEGNNFIFDDSYWQMIAVAKTPDGITISFPERAD